MKKSIDNLTKITYPAEYETVRIPQQKCFPPRSFQGYQPLAYVRDIITLQRRIVQWLTGSEDLYAITSLISSNGFLPLNISGLADSKYFGMETQYNTKLINNKAINYNFFGKNVRVTQSAERPDKVNIEIRRVKCASNLGTFDGRTNGNAYLTSATYKNATTGILPDLYSVVDKKINFGDWTDRQLINIYQYNTNRFEVETPDYINFASSGTFFVIAVVTPESKTTNVVQSEVITPGILQPSLETISGNQNIILAGQNQNIIFSIKDWKPDDGNTYKAKIKVSFNLNNIFKDENYFYDVKPTRFKIMISHHNYDVTSFQTFLNWDHWLEIDPEINNYIKENIYTWTSKDYLYATAEPLSYDDLEYQFENTCNFKSSEINQIYQGNISFYLNNIVNLYNVASVYNNVQISSNLTDNNVISSIFYPTQNIYQANKEITYKITLPLKQNIYDHILSAKVYIQNAFEKIQFTKIFNLKNDLNIMINTLSSKYFSNETSEYFYDENKLDNMHFGEKYRKISSTIDITKNDLQVIPGSGLFYNTGTQNYIRIFDNNNNTDKITLEFHDLHVKNITEFLNNLYIKKYSSTKWEQLNPTYIEEIYFKNNNYLSLILKPILDTKFLLKLIINNIISDNYQLICNTIKIKNYSNNSEQALNQLLLEFNHLKNLILK